MRIDAPGRWVWLLVAMASGASAAAQGTREDYERAQRLVRPNLRKIVSTAEVSPHWIGGGSRFWYRSEGPEGARFTVVDPEQNTSAPAFNHAQVASALSRAAQREFSATKLPFEELEFVDDGAAIRFVLESVQWTCRLAEADCAGTPQQDRDPTETLSPDGRWAARVRDHDLFLRDTSTGTVVRLTEDGESNWDYATPLPSLDLMVEQRTEDVHQKAAVFWSPDSQALVTYRIDSRHSGRFTSLQFVPPEQLRPRAFSCVYPLPGEVLAKAAPIIFHVRSGRRVDVKTLPIELPFQEGPSFEWFPDGRRFFYEYEERGYKSKELREVDAETGEQRVLVREESRRYVDPGLTSFRFANTTGEVLGTSERDGWNHLYLFVPDSGRAPTQLTRGPWVVRRIEHVDEGSRRVYFLANGREPEEDPYQAHLYSVGFDGRGLTRLSPENAEHGVSVSPDARYFVDNFSRPDLPGHAVLRRTSDGAKVRDLEAADVSGLVALGWRPPEPFQGKAADGTTDLHGLIWRPSNFDPARKYPIVELVYTGPQWFFVPKSFGAALRSPQLALVELGFIGVMVDGRGTTGRSRAFHEFSYRNLGGAFEDHVAMIRQMAEAHPEMDATRVGIYGTSAGGYGAAHAMLAFPDFYSVGVSTSGDHDARLDKAWWNELYQGYPVQDDYVAQSNVTMAGRLKGDLLIEHGDLDGNVHPVATMRFVDALMKAQKDFDMLLVPNMFHGESGEHDRYLVRRRWDYFVEHLLGAKPPRGFEIAVDEDVRRPSRRF